MKVHIPWIFVIINTRKEPDEKSRRRAGPVARDIRTSVTVSLEEIIMMKALSIVSLILSSVAAAVSIAAAVVSIVSIRNSKFQD